jgi:hypothetical protein
MDAAKRHKREGQYGADVVSAAIQRLEEGLVVEGFVPAASRASAAFRASRCGLSATSPCMPPPLAALRSYTKPGRRLPRSCWDLQVAEP